MFVCVSIGSGPSHPQFQGRREAGGKSVNLRVKSLGLKPALPLGCVLLWPVYFFTHHSFHLSGPGQQGRMGPRTGLETPEQPVAPHRGGDHKMGLDTCQHLEKSAWGVGAWQVPRGRENACSGRPGPVREELVSGPRKTSQTFSRLEGDWGHICSGRVLSACS